MKELIMWFKGLIWLGGMAVSSFIVYFALTTWPSGFSRFFLGTICGIALFFLPYAVGVALEKKQ